MLLFLTHSRLFIIKSIIILITLLSFSIRVNAQSELWVACTDSLIYRINVDSCSATLIGNSSIVFMDIAINPQDSVLYGVSGGNLYTIDKVDAHTTLVGPFVNTNALCFDSYGNLYATGGSWEIYKINLSTGISTNLGKINNLYNSAGDLTFYKGGLYLSCMPNLLVEIDLSYVPNSISVGNFANINNVFGSVTLAKECNEVMYAFEGRNIHQLDSINLLNSFNKCPNIVPSGIFGAASLTESISTIAISLGSDTTICKGDSIVLRDLLNSISTSNLWSNGSINDSIMVNYASTYILTKEYNSCTFTDTINVGILGPPNIQLGSDTSICGNKSIKLMVNDSSSFFLWSDGSNDNYITVKQKGTYWIDATNKCGTSSDTIRVVGCDCILVVPNAFTPNQDGLNDIFSPIFKCEFLKYEFLVFNRWGKLIFHTNNPFLGWDGTYNKANSPSATYVYLINYTSIDGESRSIKGNFFLVK